MESFFGTLKSELVHHRAYRTRDEARADLFFYIEAFYNRRRRHSALDYRSPEAYEQPLSSAASTLLNSMSTKLGEGQASNGGTSN